MSFRQWFSKSQANEKSGADAANASPNNALPRLSPDDLADAAPLTDPEHFGSQPLTPFNKERIVAYFIKEGYKFSYDDDCDIVGVWDGHPFWFLFLNTDYNFFQVRGRWQREVSHASRSMMLHAMNDWNRDRIWPKAYIREDEDGTVNLVFGETSFDFSDGVTDLQLHYSIDYALQTSLQFFSHLSAMMPPENAEEIREDDD